MTQEQYDNWKDFTTRMGATVYKNLTLKRKEKIKSQIANYFQWRDFQNDWPDILDWDGNGDDYFLGEAVDEFFDEYRHWSRKEGCYTGKFYNQITCCIRAGFDMAVKQSGGVLGFSVGDIRQMYDGNVPLWVTPNHFNNEPNDTPIWL